MSRGGGLAGVRVLEPARKEDARGWLQKILLRSDLVPGQEFGELYVVSARPGAARGNHLHRRMGEWFAVIAGSGEVIVADPATGERRAIPLGEESPRTVYVPPGIAHAIVNTGSRDLIAVAWADAEHDPEDVEPFAVASSPAEPPGLQREKRNG